MDLKTGRPVDVRSLGGNWPTFYEAFTKKSEEAQARKAKWDSENAKNRQDAKL
jgi:hypothetical protein